MLHVTTALARRIELAEGELAAASARASSPESIVERIAGGIVAVSASSPFSKAIGLGFDGPLSDEDLASLERIFKDAGGVPHVELCPHGHHEVPAQLALRHIVLRGFENVLARTCSDEPLRPGFSNQSVRVAAVTQDEQETWLRVVSRGFAAAETATPEEAAAAAAGPEELAEVMRPVLRMAGVHRMIAWNGEQPLGGIACSIIDEFCLMYGAATVPEARRRGVQAALVASALEWSRAQGSSLAIATTLPGSTSQRTLERFGFQVIYTRAILTRLD